jgi:ATP citrate (pro-S)-lyase
LELPKHKLVSHTTLCWFFAYFQSVVYADTISDLGFGHELANYGEYSGAPSTEHTFEYAKTLIGLMTREKEHQGKIFIIGGGIANFTDVAATFTGLINAIMAFQEDLKTHRVKIWVRETERNLAIYNLI